MSGRITRCRMGNCWSAEGSFEYLDILKQLIPNWKSLCLDSGAEKFRRSLRTWAQSENLDCEWVLDFALSVLKTFEVNIIAAPRGLHKGWDSRTRFSKAVAYAIEGPRKSFEEALRRDKLRFDCEYLCDASEVGQPPIPKFHFANEHFQCLGDGAEG